MLKLTVKGIIEQLKKREISIFDIPKEYGNNIQIINYERKAGLRIIGKRGFDVIRNSFFVEEVLLDSNSYPEDEGQQVFSLFSDFDSYFNFLNGAIYDNSCYTFCDFKNKIISSHKISIQKLLLRKSFIDDTVDCHSLSASKDEICAYEDAKRIHALCQKWIEKFNLCENYRQLVKTVINYRKSKIASVVGVAFFFFQFLFADINSKERFDIIMEYISSGAYPEYKVIKALCLIHNPDDVMQAFSYYSESNSTICKWTYS